MAQTYEALSIAAYLLAALSLLLAVFLWFRFKIWGVIGDLSGRTARKSIEEMRRINEKSGRKSYRPTPIGVSRGKVTEVMENQQIPVRKTLPWRWNIPAMEQSFLAKEQKCCVRRRNRRGNSITLQNVKF